MTESLRNHGDHDGATAVYVVQAPQWRLRCDGGSTAEARRNMFKVSAVPPRRSAVLTVFGGATAINDGITAELRRSWRCHCGLCRTSTAVAPRIRCDGGITKQSLHLLWKQHTDCVDLMICSYIYDENKYYSQISVNKLHITHNAISITA